MKAVKSLNGIYTFVGGRKVFIFWILLFINVYILLRTDKWTEGFGYFSVFLYSAIIVGIEGGKVIKGKNAGEKNE